MKEQIFPYKTESLEYGHLTKREYFAGQAIIGLMIESKLDHDGVNSDYMATLAVKISRRINRTTQ